MRPRKFHSTFVNAFYRKCTRRYVDSMRTKVKVWGKGKYLVYGPYVVFTHITQWSTSYCRFWHSNTFEMFVSVAYLFILIFRDGWMGFNVSPFCHSVVGWFSHQTNSMWNPRKSWRAQIGMCDCVCVCVYVAGNIRSCELEQACRVIKSKCEYVI